jgi:lipid A 3-O-deacylase
VNHRTFLAAIALSGAVAAELPAQAFLASQVRADNDAFNFWLAPWLRPDEEYTSGVKASLDYAGQAWWRGLIGGDVEACVAGEAKGTRCATRSYAFGQDIYTGVVALSAAATTVTRPNAGWLYVQEAERVATPTRLDETSVTVGMTGEPSLASYVQRVVHGYVAAFNRPIDWSHQLPFEPGFVLHYEQTRRLLAFDGPGLGADVEPHVGGSLGTILVDGTAGVRARVGYALAHPWLPGGPSRRGVPSFETYVDATIHGVARNEFLDGTAFRSSERVRSRPGVAEYQAGLSTRWHEASVSYGVHWLGSEYVGRRDGHTWSSIQVEWRPARR